MHRLHEQIDDAVAEAYGWPADLAPAIVARLVALNAERKAEEEAGTIRWLRPDYQEPRFGKESNHFPTAPHCRLILADGASTRVAPAIQPRQAAAFTPTLARTRAQL